MDRRKLQLALMSRGIRVSDDDPLFIVLEANEIHFDEMVIRHFDTLDQHLILKAVSRALSIQTERQSQTQQFRCVGGVTVEKAAARLESVVYTLGQFEDKMSDSARDAARVTTREVAGQVLNKLALEVSTGLTRFDALRPEVAAIGESTKTIIGAAQQIHGAVRRVEAWWLVFALLIAAALYIGICVGHFTTTGAYERVQAACTGASKATTKALQ